MAVIIYPRDYLLYRRDTTNNPAYEEIAISTYPNTIIYLDISQSFSSASATTFYFTSSYALTSSYTSDSISSSYSETSSYLNGSGTIPVNYKTVTSNDTILNTDHVIYASASINNITLTMPFVSDVDGQLFKIKKIDYTGYNIIITSSVKIDYDTELRLSHRGSSVTLHSDGNQYWIH